VCPVCADHGHIALVKIKADDGLRDWPGLSRTNRETYGGAGAMNGPGSISRDIPDTPQQVDKALNSERQVQTKFHSVSALFLLILHIQGCISLERLVPANLEGH
jgi:hypothetical protein